MLKKYFWTIFETISTVIFQFLSVIILARVLSPKDYGMLGIITIFIAIGNLLVDSGMGSAIVKKEKVTPNDYSTLFIFNLVISIILYLLFFGIAGLVAKYYAIHELITLIRTLSLVIFISALGVVQNTKLVKELKFKQLAIIALISNSISLITAIVLAFNGFGIWALVYQQITLLSIRVILLFYVNRFLPTLTFSLASFKYQFKFGINILFSNLLNTTYLNISTSIIPKIAGTLQNGYYVQANRLKQVPISIITSITDKAMFPILAQSNNIPELNARARQLVRYTTLISFPIIFFCSALSGPIVYILLGNKWISSSPYLGILFFTGIGECIQYLGRNLLKSHGVTKKIFYLEIIKTTIGLTILIISSFWGILFLIYGIVSSSIILSFITMIYLNNYSDYKIKEQISDFKEPLFFSFIAYALIKILNHFFLNNTAWSVLYFLFGFLSYIIIGIIFKNKETNTIISKITIIIKKYL